jgi:hypothetical protein
MAKRTRASEPPVQSLSGHTLGTAFNLRPAGTYVYCIHADEDELLVLRGIHGPDTDDLLYIGITNNLFRRLDRHEEKSWWWKHAGHVTWEIYPTRKRAYTAEQRLIHMYRPVGNTTCAYHPYGTPVKGEDY